MKKLFTVLSVLAFLTAAGNALAAEEIKIGVLNFAPFYLVEEGKEPSGMMLDFLKAAMDKAGLAYSVKGYPPKRLYQNLAEGKSHVFLGIKGVPELEGKVIYSRSKITEIDMRVYTRPDTPVLKTKEEMKGKKIIVIRGYSYGGFIKFLQDPANKIEMDESDDHDTAFKKLMAKRADYVLDYSKPSEKAIASLNLTGIQNHSINLIDIVLIVSNQTPNAQEVADKLEKAFDELKKEGKLADL
ncbi:MAG: substrate-binding periplasmic protein [Thermodesulfobacteriota bacterium]